MKYDMVESCSIHMILHEDISQKIKLLIQVQLHPTGFIDPSDPSNSTKYLAPEALVRHLFDVNYRAVFLSIQL